MSEWKTYKLCEVADLSTGFPFNGHKYAKEGQRVVRGDNVTIGELRWDTDKDKRWNEPFVRAEEFSLREGDIVIGMDGSRVGRNRAQIKAEDLPLLLAQRVACVRHNAKSLQKFLYYQIFSKNFENYIKSVHTGTSIPHVSLKQIGDFSFQVPDLLTQQRIAAILGSLDDKIELNRRINANLEEQAQALFKSWFVDFEPFRDGPFVDSELGKIPKGWKVNSIEDLASYIASGGTPRSLDSSYYDGDIRWFTTKELKDEFLFDSEKHISQTALKNSAAKLFPENTVLMAIYASPTVGRLGILTAESTCNQAAVGIIAKEEIGYAYLYLLLLSERINLNNLASGAAQQNLNVGIVKRYRVLVPTIDILGTFNEIINPIFATIRNNTAQIYNLSALRDTLLPKLMSSELSVESDYEL